MGKKCFLLIGSIMLAFTAFLISKANNQTYFATTLFSTGLGTVARQVSGHPALTLSTLRSGHTAFIVTQASRSSYYGLTTGILGNQKWYAK